MTGMTLLGFGEVWELLDFGLEKQLNVVSRT